MSISDLIHVAVGKGQLAHLPFLYDPAPARRVVLLAPEIQGLVFGPWGCEDAEKRCTRLRADLEDFARGGIVTVSLEPFRARSANSALLHETRDEIWDVRSREPSPGLRVFGAFAARDVFVALSCWPRSRAVRWLPRPPLGRGTSAEYAVAIEDARKQWRMVFGDAGRHGNGGADVEEYISERALLV